MGNAFSNTFNGVRQGAVFPLCYFVYGKYIDKVIKLLRYSTIGCHWIDNVIKTTIYHCKTKPNIVLKIIKNPPKKFDSMTIFSIKNKLFSFQKFIPLTKNFTLTVLMLFRNCVLFIFIVFMDLVFGT